jgi:hypothetical protein
MNQRLAIAMMISALACAPAFAQSQSGPVLQRRPVDPNATPTPVYTPDQQTTQPAQQYPQQAPAQTYPQPAQQQYPAQQYPAQQPYPAQQQTQQYPQTQPQYPQNQYPQQPYSPGYAAPNMIPTGATFMVRLKDNLDSNKVSPGKKFSAELAEDLLAPDGSVLVPRGKKLHGHITEADRGALHSRMMLNFYEIETRHGWMPLIASVNSVPGEQGVAKVSEEGEITRKSSTRREVEAAGIGAAVGATSGAVFGGGKGAAIGAGAGAAMGAVGGVLTGRDVRLSKGDPVELRLERDLRVPTH